jgi:hypothetical protein
MAETHTHNETFSKMSLALAEEIIAKYPKATESLKEHIATVIDSRLAEIRKHYKPEEFARCPVVSHHGKPPCQFCVTAAMREFILLPEEL